MAHDWGVDAPTISKHKRPKKQMIKSPVSTLEYHIIEGENSGELENFMKINNQVVGNNGEGW